MADEEDATAKARRVWDAFAPRYDRGMRFVERWAIGGGREWVCSRARGDVLEVAIGSGLNLPHYPAGTTLTGVELSPAMLSLARRRAAELGRQVDLRVGDGAALPFDDASFDTVVCTLSLCAIPDDRAAIAQMWRVLRPGGRLLLLDHVASDRWPLRAVQRLVEQLTVRSAGEHLTRRPLPLAREVGFEVTEVERRKAGMIEWFAARKPG